MTRFRVRTKNYKNGIKYSFGSDSNTMKNIS